MSSRKYCTNCGNPVNENNQFCTSCGNSLTINKEPVNNNVQTNKMKVDYHKKPWLAVLLSLLFFGQFYNGEILKGLVFMVILLSLLIVSSAFGQPLASLLFFLFYLYMFYDAYKNAKKINENENYSYI